MKLAVAILLLTATVGYALDITSGTAYYTDVDLECSALYVQLPLIDLDPVRLNLGIVMPLAREEFEYFGGRSCPEVSITYKYGNWEVGAYAAMTYYHGWGFLVGYELLEL